ncbi:uncharacterized protein K02A2.6-like [Actinia tenebrosa]|uniref:Uncharacterized protein K02A2.6-like n=1 Tax=Actinia tenebrosa TaxID=6105 RepID=A0A6P8HCA7_ACTTE|nr:uncharacterized protein K02A2.6-like [Actinia tenebrosa]
MQDDGKGEETDSDFGDMKHVSTKGDRSPIIVTVLVEGQELSMELDTGSALSVISKETFHKGRVHQEYHPPVTHLYRGGSKTRWGLQTLARKPEVEQALDELEAEGVIVGVNYSEWAAPIVTPVKKDGSVRVCGDFKVTINPQLEIDEYPLPRIEDIYASLSGGKQFSTLDLRQAYLQMEVDEQSKHYLTVNTHRGLFQYQRLPYGVASAPAIWQRAMDQVLQCRPGVQCYLYDIVVTGKSEREHLDVLDKMLQRLEEYGLKANKGKCKFLQEYLGHVISAEGLRQSPKKTKAIVEMPATRT